MLLWSLRKERKGIARRMNGSVQQRNHDTLCSGTSVLLVIEIGFWESHRSDGFDARDLDKVLRHGGSSLFACIGIAHFLLTSGELFV